MGGVFKTTSILLIVRCCQVTGDCYLVNICELLSPKGARVNMVRVELRGLLQDSYRYRSFDGCSKILTDKVGKGVM